MSLQVKLDIFKAQFEAGAPPYNVKPEVVASMHRATSCMSGDATCWICEACASFKFKQSEPRQVSGKKDTQT
jgi:hypothetical protein